MNQKENKLKEFKLRRLIKKAIRIREVKKSTDVQKQLQEEKQLRKMIHYLILNEEVDADTNPAPYESTPMNILADVLDQALPVLKSGLRKLSKPEERASYRAHVLEKLVNLFSTIESMDVQGVAIGESDIEDADNVVVNIEAPEGMVVPPSEKERFEPKELSPEEKEASAYKKFAIAGENPTGARVAFDTFSNSNIASLIANKRKLLADNEEDTQQFKNFALYNADLWLITYEDEISDELGQESAFTETIIEKPMGAQVKATPGKPWTQDPGGGIGIEEGEFEEELEEILMMETNDVGE